MFWIGGAAYRSKMVDCKGERYVVADKIGGRTREFDCRIHMRRPHLNQKGKVNL